MDERIEALARKLAAQFGDWRNWDTAKSVCDTPSGNEPEEERDYWRGIARVAFAAGREAMRSEAVNAADDSLPPPGRGGAKSEYVQGWLDGTDSIAAAIRALPGKEG